MNGTCQQCHMRKGNFSFLVWSQTLCGRKSGVWKDSRSKLVTLQVEGDASSGWGETLLGGRVFGYQGWGDADAGRVRAGGCAQAMGNDMSKQVC